MQKEQFGDSLTPQQKVLHLTIETRNQQLANGSKKPTLTLKNRLGQPELQNDCSNSGNQSIFQPGATNHTLMSSTQYSKGFSRDQYIKGQQNENQLQQAGIMSVSPQNQQQQFRNTFFHGRNNQNRVDVSSQNRRSRIEVLKQAAQINHGSKKISSIQTSEFSSAQFDQKIDFHNKQPQHKRQSDFTVQPVTTTPASGLVLPCSPQSKRPTVKSPMTAVNFNKTTIKTQEGPIYELQRSYQDAEQVSQSKPPFMNTQFNSLSPTAEKRDQRGPRFSTITGSTRKEQDHERMLHLQQVKNKLRSQIPTIQKRDAINWENAGFSVSNNYGSPKARDADNTIGRNRKSRITSPDFASGAFKTEDASMSDQLGNNSIQMDTRRMSPSYMFQQTPLLKKVSEPETIQQESQSRQNMYGPTRLTTTDFKSPKNRSLYITNDTSPDNRNGFIESQLSGANTNNVSTNFQSPVARGTLIPEIPEVEMNQLEVRDDLLSTMPLDNGIMSRYNEEQKTQLMQLSMKKGKLGRLQKNFQPICIKKSLLEKGPLSFKPSEESQVEHIRRQVQKFGKVGGGANLGFSIANKKQSSPTSAYTEIIDTKKIIPVSPQSSIKPTRKIKFQRDNNQATTSIGNSNFSLKIKAEIEALSLAADQLGNQFNNNNSSPTYRQKSKKKSLAINAQDSANTIRRGKRPSVLQESGKLMIPDKQHTLNSTSSITSLDRKRNDFNNSPSQHFLRFSMEDNREGKMHIDRSLLDRRHYDPYVKRLQEKMSLASQIQQDQLHEYIGHLNQIATEQNSIVLKKGGKIEFPESQFAILERETRINFKKKFKAYATEQLEFEPQITYAIINNDYDKQKRKRQEVQEITNKQRQLEFLTGPTTVKEDVEGHTMQKELDAVYTFQELVELEKARCEKEHVVIAKKNSYKQIETVKKPTKKKPQPKVDSGGEETQQEERQEEQEEQQDEEERKNPEIVFLTSCRDGDQAPLPILSTVTNRTLSLGNYTLSDGHCKALNEAAQHFDKFVNRTRLQNCGISDHQLGNLITTFSQLNDFKSFVLRQNVFEKECVEAMKLLLAKKAPLNLQELRMNTINIPANVLKELVFTITETRTQLQKLELSNVGLDADCINTLVPYINTSMRLEELDLSWNQVSAHNFEKLLKNLAKNKRLRDVNLSWNNMTERESLPSKRPSQITMDAQAHRQLAIQAMSGFNKIVSNHLRQFLWINRRLIHLDLSYTSLSSGIMYKMLPAIRKAKTLMAIHFTGNPGVTQEFKAWTAEKLDCNLPMACEGLDLTKILKKSTLEKQHHVLMQESLQVKQITAQKKMESEKTTMSMHADDKLILTRKLGYLQEDPLSAQWQLIDKPRDVCWICDKQIRSYIFWFRGLEQEPGVTISLDQDEKQSLKNEVKKNFKSNEDYTEVLDGRDPVIIGSFTDWQPKKMLRMVDFLQNVGPIEEKLTDEKLLREYKKFCFSNPKNKSAYVKQDEDFMFDETKSAEERMQRMNEYQLGKIKTFRGDFLRSFYNHWDWDFENYFNGYKKPFMINSRFTLKQCFEDLYVHPTFITSGRCRFVIQDIRTAKLPQPDLVASDLSLYRAIVEFRDEDITPWPKNLPHQVFKREFFKGKSVFSQWKKDDEDIVQKCMSNDKYIRKTVQYARSLGDPGEADIAEDYMEQYFNVIKEIFIQKAAETAFPRVSTQGFNSLLIQLGFVKDVAQTSEWMRLFKAAEAQVDQAKKQQNLNRSQFFELILRIGGERYHKIETSSIGEALRLLINENLNSLQKRYCEWQTFRDKELWNVDVNDVFEFNVDKIKRVYEYFSRQNVAQNKGPILTIQEAVVVFKSLVQISEQQATYCLGMSKMTQEKDDGPSYRNIYLVEFLEAIGRVAKLKFAGTARGKTTTLAEKIEYILDDLLEPLKLQRSEVVIDEEEQDEEFASDIEY